MVKRKTSAPFVLSCRLFFLHANDLYLILNNFACWMFNKLYLTRIFKNFNKSLEEKILDLFGTVGVFFQIKDDYCNLTDQNYWNTKGFCDDIHEKKFSFPIIRVVRGKQGRYEELLALYGQKDSFTREQLEEALQIIRETDALEYTRKRCLDLKNKILSELRNEGLLSLESVLLELMTL
jgi:geranylgeranyl diphosphate synthase type 3